MGSAEYLLREYTRAGDGLDRAALRRLLHPDVVTHAPGDVTVRGIEGQIEVWEVAHRGLDDLTHEIVAIVEADDLAAARIVASGVHTGPFLGVEPTGTVVRVDQALFIRIDGSKIVEIWETVDTGSGLRQLGVLDDQELSPGKE